MRVTVRQRINILRRSFPNIASNYARYLYAKPADLGRSGSMVKVWTIVESVDGRTSLRQTNFRDKNALSVAEWAMSLNERIPFVYQECVMPSVNAKTGTMWALKIIVGWHFVKPPTKRERTAARQVTTVRRT